MVSTIEIKIDDAAVRAAVAQLLRNIAAQLDRAETPPADPNPIDPPIEPPRDPWTHVDKSGLPSAPGWYSTLTAADAETAAHPHYWDGSQWLWKPDWFPAAVNIDRYQVLETAPTNFLMGVPA